MSTHAHSEIIRVLGLYSPAANDVEYERFIRHRMSWLIGDEFTPEDRIEAEAELREALSTAVVVDALVRNLDERFDVIDFVQADPSKPESEWQVAWNETYLTADGNKILDERFPDRLPTIAEFRIVFVIHLWKPSLPLMSSYGELSVPPIQPQPERLWRLVPYQLTG